MTKKERKEKLKVSLKHRRHLKRRLSKEAFKAYEEKHGKLFKII